MSHFAVAVFHTVNQTVDELLAPYEENVDFDLKDEADKARAIIFAREHYRNGKDKSDEACFRRLVRANKRKGSDVMYAHNPDGKWDYWERGGRWPGLLRIKNSKTEAFSAQVKDIDFSPNPDKYSNALAEWNEIVGGAPRTAITENYSNGLLVDTKKDLIALYHDGETYAKSRALFETVAVVTPDGEWHEPGAVGWFGAIEATCSELREWREHYKERFIDTADPEWVLTIVDCHI